MYSGQEFYLKMFLWRRISTRKIMLSNIKLLENGFENYGSDAPLPRLSQEEIDASAGEPLLKQTDRLTITVQIKSKPNFGKTHVANSGSFTY